jgi:hypothetical protein
MTALSSLSTRLQRTGMPGPLAIVVAKAILAGPQT